MADLAATLIALNQKLLESIVAGDWREYHELCDDSITCFEAEARGQLVAGMAFHRFYFELDGAPPAVKKVVTMASPHVRLMGDSAAIVSYVRLTQGLDAAGVPQTAKAEETRVWQKIEGAWKHVHFHRSANS